MLPSQEQGIKNMALKKRRDKKRRKEENRRQNTVISRRTSVPGLARMGHVVQSQAGRECPASFSPFQFLHTAQSSLLSLACMHILDV